MEDMEEQHSELEESVSTLQEELFTLKETVEKVIRNMQLADQGSTLHYKFDALSYFDTL